MNSFGKGFVFGLGAYIAVSVLDAASVVALRHLKDVEKRSAATERDAGMYAPEPVDIDGEA